MKSRTSSFNPTVFKKNLTRFAPVWILYTLCLLMGMILLYTADHYADTKNFWFASRMGDCIQYLGLVNLFWAPLVAMLLFGDLYNSRMCNALHAMPMRRECWFVTNVVSGLTFSLLPTLIMALCSIPLLVQTCVVDAWQIAFWFFLGANLSFICFFGIAVFSVFCAGNRLSMGLVYALINGGAFLVFWLVDTIYTPMLYGVVTPDRLAFLLTPIASMLDNNFVEVESYLELRELYEGRLDQMVAEFWLTENWGSLIAYALAGVVFAAIGLILYRRRDLECAGDMMAFRAMEPVFVVLFAVLSAAAAQFFLYTFLGSRGLNILFLATGLVVGWFAGHMLVARSTRVFRLKNWLKLAALAAVIAASLAATHFDVFGFEDWMPDVGKVKSATISQYGGNNQVEVTDTADIENLIRLQELALEEKLMVSGDFPLDESVTWVDGEGYCHPDGTPYEGEFYYVSTLWITYTLDTGKTIQRCYKLRLDEEARTLANEYLSRWECFVDTRHYNDKPLVLSTVESISISGNDIPEEYVTQEDAEALMAAIMADCEERTMTQSSCFHNGHFYGIDEDGDLMRTRSMWISIRTQDGGFGIDFFADSRHIIAWCEERGLMNSWNVSDLNVYGG